MPFSIPTLNRLINRAKSDIESILNNGAVYLRRSFETATAYALGGLAHTMHQHLRFIADQILPDTAEEEFLVRKAELHLGPNARLPATAASFPILVTGTIASTPIPVTSRWTRPDGKVYAPDGAYALPGTPPYEVSVTVVADDAGEDGNTVPGVTMTIVVPIGGVDSEATVEGSDFDPIGGGSDIETIEALKARLIEHLQNPPKGGGSGDYVSWAKASSSSVTRAWEVPNGLGAGTVLVYFVQDTFDEDGFWEDTIFPTAGDVEDVQEYIEAPGRAPVIATVTVAAPSETVFSPSIQLEPNTAAVQLAVQRQLEDLLLREASAAAVTIPLSRINEAISLASGETDHVLTSPVADVVSPLGELLTLGSISFSAIP